MKPLAEQLMAGPRGRALCLYVGLHHESWRAMWALALEPDRERGLPWYRAERDRELTDAQLESIRELRQGLVGSHRLADESVREALEHTVDGAVYWQDPRDEEMVGSLPALEADLRRVAATVAASQTAAWWTEPFDPEQYVVRFRPVDHVTAVNTPAVAILVEAYRIRDVREPPGYLTGWWSAPPSGLAGTAPAPGGIPSALYLVEDGWGQTEATVHRARSRSPRVFEVDSGVAWAQLCRSHPFEVTASKRHDWYRTTGLADTRWVMPDWASVAGEYDAVHLQVGAYLAASGTAIAVDDGVHSVIAGWAPGDTYWLTDVVEVDPVGRAFAKSADTDLWHPA